MENTISYAMQNEEATQALIYFNAPDALKDWSFLAIEWLIVIGFVLTLCHAIKHSRESGSPAAILTFAMALLYGLVMDIASYYTVENFWHGEFSVMLLYNKLPLYIVLFYPAVMYHVYMTIRRYEFKPVTEAISTAFFAGTFYLIFDNFGPQVNWWIWDAANPTTWPYVSSVPLTSYHWFFLFTGAFAYVARTVCWKWTQERKSTGLVVTGLVTSPITIILLGSLLFIPYNLFSKNMPPWDTVPWEASLIGASIVHAVVFFLAGLVFLLSYKKVRVPRDKLLMIFPLVYLMGHLYLYIAKFSLFFGVTTDGLTTEGLAVGNLLAAMMAIVVCTVIVLISHPVED